MSSHNEQLQPTPFEVAQPPQPEQSETKPAASWILPALGGLLLLALLVFFWLPEQVSPPQLEQAPPAANGTITDRTPGAAAVKPVTSADDGTPWSEAQLAKLRKEAQDVLADLLEIQFALQERGVAQWAPEPFAAAAASAAAGDELYRQRQYVEARHHYEEGRAQLQALQDSVPQVLASQLELARQALEDGAREQADAALDLAAIIEPDNGELATLRQRAAALDQLLSLLEQADAAQLGGDLAAAEQLLQQAAELDPQHQRTRGELQRVAAAHLAQRFNDAMSDGYTALDQDRFEQARQAFSRAAQLQPGSGEAASALQEVQTTQTAHRLATLKQSGGEREQAEQWQQAVAAYEQAQQIDADVLFARDGLERTRSRARLDKQFRAAIEQPQRLSDVAVAEATGQLLQQAQKISPRGPVLEQQIDRLQRLLQQANTPVAVTLHSDEETEVIVYKVARLGRFQQRELSLRPGTYTAVGTRNGYRDVRHNFTVGHDSAPLPVTIACTEPI